MCLSLYIKMCLYIYIYIYYRERKRFVFVRQTHRPDGLEKARRMLSSKSSN